MKFDYDEAMGFIVPLSHNVYRSYRMVDLADIQQTMLEWMLANPRKYREYLADEDHRRGNRMLSASLLNRGRAFCQREKAAQAGYRVEDLHFYSQSEIEELIPQVYDTECWISPPKGERSEGGTKQDPAVGGGHLAALADVADAIRRVDNRTEAVLSMLHYDHYTQREVARLLGLAESTVSEIVSRAPGKLQRLLGGSRPYDEPDEEPVGHRLVLTNAASQAAVSNGYDGD